MIQPGPNVFLNMSEIKKYRQVLTTSDHWIFSTDKYWQPPDKYWLYVTSVIFTDSECNILGSVCQVINSGGSGTVPAGLPQGETEQVSIISTRIKNHISDYPGVEIESTPRGS